MRVRVRVRARLWGWVGSTLVPLSDQEVLSARICEQPTAPKTRAANLIGELPPEPEPERYGSTRAWMLWLVKCGRRGYCALAVVDAVLERTGAADTCQMADLKPGDGS